MKRLMGDDRVRKQQGYDGPKYKLYFGCGGWRAFYGFYRMKATRRKRSQLFNDNPRGKPRLRTLGYGTRKKAMDSVRKLKKMNKTYQRQAATTMYYRAKHHAHRTANMEEAMEIYGEFLDTL